MLHPFTPVRLPTARWLLVCALVAILISICLPLSAEPTSGDPNADSVAVDASIAAPDEPPTSLLDEARDDHQRALLRKRQARDIEIDADAEHLQGLLDQKQELADQWVNLSEEGLQTLQELHADHQSQRDDFTDQRSRINAALLNFSDSPSDTQVAENIDPLFERLVDTRRNMRRQLNEQHTRVTEAEDRIESRADAAHDALERWQQLHHDDPTDDAAGLHAAIAELELFLARQHLTNARRLHAMHRQHRDLLVERTRFYHEAVESLFPLISPEQRSQFLSLRRDSNWHDAIDAFHHAFVALIAGAEERFQEVADVEDRFSSVPFWIWFFGFMWRLALFVAVFFVGRDFASDLVHRLTDALIERRFLRRFAAWILKLGTVLQTLIRPTLLWITAVILVRYLSLSWTELALLEWLVSALFIYWMVILAIKVLVLPRDTWSSRSGDESDEASPYQFDRLLDIEQSRADKILRSTRVILLFWLLAYYVPRLVIYATGHNVVWFVVDRIATWGLVAVIYSVLSTWRDTIAASFSDMASERMPRATDIVDRHKDRPWGVLLIALVTLYIAGRESARLTRTYLRDTAWSRRISNFFFRKSVELHQRDHDRDDASCPIPDHYRHRFHHRPLDDEPYIVERRELLKRLEKGMRAWEEDRSKGMLVLIGEQGMGRTTLLHQIQRRWSNYQDRKVLYHQLQAPCRDCPSVRQTLASVFDLDEWPDDDKAFAQALLDLPPRTILLDDCHRLFLREIGGFDTIDLLFKIISLTDHHHFWIVTLNRHTWSYINRVKHRGHFFQDVIELTGWSEDEIRDMINQRDALDDTSVSFEELIVSSGDDNQDNHYELVQSSRGYFRLLHEFSQGNPSVALTFWLRSLTADDDHTLRVGLFPRPSLETLQQLDDNYLFALAAIAQHGALNADEVGRTIHASRGDCEMILKYLADNQIVTLDNTTGRARIRPLYLRSVTRVLRRANVLYG